MLSLYFCTTALACGCGCTGSHATSTVMQAWNPCTSQHRSEASHLSCRLLQVAPTCGASNTQGISCDKMPCQARVISGISRLGGAHEVSSSIAPFSPYTSVRASKPYCTRIPGIETNCRRQVGKNWMISRQVRCRSFLRFKDCGRTRDSPPGQENAIILGSH